MARAAVAQEVEFELGPFRGIYDSSDTGEARAYRLFDSKNVVVLDADEGSAAVERHGFLGLTGVLGTSTARTGQGVYTHRRLSGIIDRLMFSGGKMYRWDGAAIATDITPTGVVIDRENPVFCASYNDQIIISDEQNKPWIYTPVTGVAQLIEIDDLHTEWGTKGGPFIYGGVVFFILKAQGASPITTETDVRITTEDDRVITTELLSGLRNTIIWGEPLDPATGYDQLDFDNVWQLTQTSNEILGVAFGEEGRLVYYRNKGIGELTGPVDENFRGSATKDSGSTTVGTDAPAAAIAIDKKHYFVDLDGRVYRYRPGSGEPEQLWYPQRRAGDEHVGVAANRETVVTCARAGFHEGYNLVLFTIWDRQTIYAFDAETGRYFGTWLVGGGIHIDAMGSSVDADNRSTFVILGTRAATRTTAEQGVIWRQKHADDVNTWLDTADAAVPGTVIPHDAAVETHWLVSDVARTYRLEHVKLELVGAASRHAVGLEYTTPAGGRSTRLVAQSTASVGVEDSADSVSQAAYSLGRNAQGAALRLRASVTHSDNVRWGVNQIYAKGTVVQARIKAK